MDGRKKNTDGSESPQSHAFGNPEENRKRDGAARPKLERLMADLGFRRPNRGQKNVEHKGCTRWLVGDMPDYAAADLAYLQGKSQNHKEGSLEEIVENLVKTWEMEASHKEIYKEWTTVIHDEMEYFVNGAGPITGKEAKEMGNYNLAMCQCPAFKELRPAKNPLTKMDFHESHLLFRDAFQGIFPWELLKILGSTSDKDGHLTSVTFTWRHWARFKGKFSYALAPKDLTSPAPKDSKTDRNASTDNEPDIITAEGTGELVEMFGLIKAEVRLDNGTYKLKKVEIFFNPEVFLGILKGKCDPADATQGRDLLGDTGRRAMFAHRK